MKIRVVVVAVLFGALSGACVGEPRAPAVPQSGAGVAFMDFVESFHLSVETNADPNLVSRSVWRVRNREDAKKIGLEFEYWCHANGGRLSSAAMEPAAQKYVAERIAQNPSSAGLFATGQACEREDRPVAAFLNVYDSNFAFYSQSPLAAFLARYLGTGSASSNTAAGANGSGSQSSTALSEERLEETAELEAEATRRISGHPKDVRPAEVLLRVYTGFMVEARAALSGKPPPPPPSSQSLAKAEEWKKRIAEACLEPRTLGCAHRIYIDSDGGLLDLVLVPHWRDSTGAEQPFTVSVHPQRLPRYQQDDNEMGAIAGNCTVSGLGYGTSSASGNGIPDWPQLQARYRELYHNEPTFVIHCPFAAPAPASPLDGKASLWTGSGGTILARAKSIPVAGVAVRTNAHSFVILAHFANE